MSAKLFWGWGQGEHPILMGLLIIKTYSGSQILAAQRIRKEFLTYAIPDSPLNARKQIFLLSQAPKISLSQYLPRASFLQTAEACEGLTSNDAIGASRGEWLWSYWHDFWEPGRYSCKIIAKESQWQWWVTGSNWKAFIRSNKKQKESHKVMWVMGWVDVYEPSSLLLVCLDQLLSFLNKYKNACKGIPLLFSWKIEKIA